MVGRVLLRLLTALFQFLGLVTFTLGAFLLAPWLGLLAAGFFLFLIGYVLEPSREVNDVPASD